MDSLSHTNPGGYCNRCYELMSTVAAIEALASQAGYQHHTGAEARTSAAKGCPLCQQLLHKWQDHASKDSDRLVCWASRGRSRCQTNPASAIPEVQVSYPYVFDGLICYRLGRGEHSHHRWVNTFTFFTSSDDPAARMLHRRPAVTDVGSESALGMARQAFENCCNNHPCCPRLETPLLPSRVIDVGSTGDWSKVALYPASPGERGKYVALSYCWGGRQRVVLTAKNGERMIKKIPFDPLQKTIKDAIKVTRALGIQFLWIDALCIIQEGDNEDKVREIGLMGQLYKNATATIFAASAKGVSEGFLQARPIPASLSLPLRCPDGRQGTAQLSLGGTHHFMYPLDTRGWTLQESLLSARKLIYGTKEQVWDCETEQKSEFPRSVFDPSWSYRLIPREIFEPKDQISVATAHSIWASIVTEYTKRRLSFPEDRLAAVTGVINQLRPGFQDECIFGLWRRNFLTQLCWGRDGPPSTASDALYEKEVLRCAPEWSWVSRKFQTRFPNLQPHDEQSWELRGNMVFIVRKLKKACDIPISQREKWNYRLDETVPVGTPYTSSFLVDHEGKEVFYLLLGRANTVRDADALNEFAMVLVPVEGGGKFRRLGLVFNYSGKSWFDHTEKQEVLLI